jgi:hypothetical protein
MTRSDKVESVLCFERCRGRTTVLGEGLFCCRDADCRGGGADISGVCGLCVEAGVRGRAGVSLGERTRPWVASLRPRVPPMVPNLLAVGAGQRKAAPAGQAANGHRSIGGIDARSVGGCVMHVRVGVVMVYVAGTLYARIGSPAMPRTAQLHCVA